MRSSITGWKPLATVWKPLAVSVAIHVVALGAVAAWFAASPAKPHSKETRGVAAGATSGSLPAPELSTRLTDSLAKGKSLSVAERQSATERYAKELERISSVESMKEIGDYLGKQLAWKPRKPSHFATPNEFDHGSATPVGAVRKKNAKGEDKLYYVFEDANRHRLEVEAAPNDLGAGTLEMLDRSAVLRQFKESILIPLLDQELNGK